MGVLNHTLSWLQTAERKYRRSMEQAAKAADREWKEGHGNSRKWESRRQTDIIAVVKSVKQRHSWAHSQDFPLHFASHTHATWQSVKGSVFTSLFFQWFPFFFPLNFLQKLTILRLLPMGGEVLLKRSLICLQGRKGSTHTIKMTVTKLCGYLGDGKTSN